MKKITFLFAVMLMAVVTSTFAQGTVTGTVYDAESNAPLPGANILEMRTSNGAVTDFDGKFSIKTNNATGTINISYVGFGSRNIAFDVTNGDQDLGVISLSLDNSLEEVIITGVVDIAKDRETPVAVSTIKAAEIQEKLGSQELPEILNNTPSIYATKQGGGFGDARINIRGFNQENTAVLINGIPINDMENGAVYWSNWAGLADVTTAMQVQRGLGSSKLAISSVGGTINVLTRSADKKEGGFVSTSVGNNDYIKTVASYSTGINEKGWSSSYLFSRTAGDGYVDGTSFEGFNYFVGVGYKPNDKHDFNFILTGAPQQHNSRGFAPSINDYIRYGSEDEPRIKYNSDWGTRNGKEFTFGGNFYHKPITSLNWEWKITENSTLSTSAYASFGRGGSIGSIGQIQGQRSFRSSLKTDDGLIRVDDIIAYNSGQAINGFSQREGYTGGGDPAYQGLFVNGNNSSSMYVSDRDHVRGAENGISQRSSVNSHNWYGGIINFNNQINENWSFDLGADLRTYKGIHYRRLVDLLGADVYVDNDNINQPYRFLTETYKPTAGNAFNVFSSIDDEEKIDYYNEGIVNWIGVFGQVEYSNDVISAFMQGSLSNQGFQRIDYFNYLDSDPEQESDVENILGGNIKAGLNWNIDEVHNVFANAGYYSKQPLFDAVFPSFISNDVNEDLVNEKIIGVELGYGVRFSSFRANFNLYRTSWEDRFENVSTTFDINGTEVRGSANILGIKQVHSGLEFDFSYKPVDQLSLNGQFSYGIWEYEGNPSATYFDESNQPINVDGIPQQAVLELDGVKVGDAPQLTASLGLGYQIIKSIKLDANYRFVDKLYADFDATDVTEDGALELPSFGLLDAGFSYKMELSKGKSLNFRFNMNNVLNEIYISESETNNFAEEGDDTYDGIATSNRVYFGLGRTWNASLRYNF
ncbi:TonB-dependent receptor [Aquimarina sp. 2-A2]|uniref:TonB-dependent receptor n=1 Tax=Aquimarina sp. 2-A2 TaxID=3382644 RepID=UPI00387F23A1